MGFLKRKKVEEVPEVPVTPEQIVPEIQPQAPEIPVYEEPEEVEEKVEQPVYTPALQPPVNQVQAIPNEEIGEVEPEQRELTEEMVISYLVDHDNRLKQIEQSFSQITQLQQRIVNLESSLFKLKGI